MEYNFSYNVLIDRFNAFADGHYLIKRFTHGQIDLADLGNDEQYPFMHVTPDSIQPANGSCTFGFHVMFADIPRDKETKAEYQREVISDCVRLAQDLIGEIKNGLTLFGYEVQMANEPLLEPFMEEYKNTLTGIAFTIQLQVPYDWSACDIPANWSVGGGSGGGGGGTAVGITFRVNGVDNAVQNILDLVAGSGITIVDNGNGSVTFTSDGGGGGEFVSTEYNANHTTATGNQYVVGDRVWYNGNVYRCIANNDALLPTNTTYWTLVDVGYRLRQSPVDYNATSGDYQILNKPTIPTELRDLTDVNIATPIQNDTLIFDAPSNEFINGQLADVAYSNDYNDLSNLPSIPAAQVNSDWSAVSGVAEILNKPTIPTATSELTNDSGYITIGDVPPIPTLTSELTNDSGFITIGDVPTQVNADWNSVGGVSEILNKPTIPTTLDSLTDVNTPAPSNAQVLTWNTATSQWIASTPSGGGGSGTVTSVALTTPAAFNVTGSPITTAGTLAITAAGVASQYIRGDGTLANFPTGGGGGASVNYYLNGSISQGTIGGAAFQQLNKTAVIGAGTDFIRTNGAGDGYIAQFITDINDPAQLLIPSGNWHFETFFSASSSGGNPSFYIELYKYDGITLTLIASNAANPELITAGVVIDLYTSVISVPATVLTATDRIAIRIYVVTSGRTLTLHTEGTHLSEITTTFSTGITALNGLTAQLQSLTTGTGGTDFGISSIGSVHTFNLPSASAANRGALSSADWSTFNGKQNNIGLTTVGTNLATLPNPSAVSYLRVNADNSVTALTATQLKTDLNIRDTFTIRMGIGPITPLDNQIYYFGETALTLSTSPILYDNKMAFACRLVGANVMVNNNAATATSEASTLFLRINNTTDVLLSNAVVFTGAPPTSTSLVVTGLNQAIAANDEFTIKWQTPNWATNPTGAQLVLTLFFERT